MKLVIADLGGISPAETERALRTLPAERRAELERLKHPESRARSIVAEIAVRLEIEKTLRLPRDEIAIFRNEAGKPHLSGAAGFHFNVSHSGDCAVCAFDKYPVGIDVEAVRPTKFRAVAERCFSAREREEIARATDPLFAFYRIWTAKESAVKQRGTTLARGLRATDTAGGTAPNGAPLSCRIFCFGLSLEARTLTEAGGAGYALSVCASERPEGNFAIEPAFVTADELLRAWHK